MGSDKEFVLVTEFFPPDTASTGEYMADIAVGLKQRGVDMQVLTAQPHYHSGANERLPHQTTHEGVDVIRVRMPMIRASSPVRYAFDWVAFTLGAFLTLLVSKPERQRELLFVSPPPTLPIALWFLCRVRGWDYSYFVYSPYPHDLVQAGFIAEHGLLASVWSWFNRRVYAGAENVITIGTELRKLILEEADDDFDDDRLAVIDLWEDEDFLRPKPKADNWFSREHDLVEAFTILYSGNIGVMHDLETLVRAATDFTDNDVQFLIIGEGTEKASIVSLAEELGLTEETVRFLPYQPYEDLPHSLTSGDVSVVTKKENMPEVSCKIYTSLAVGQPVLVIAPPGADESRIVEEFEAGIRCDPGDVDCVVQAVEQWLDDPTLVDEQGRNSRDAFENHFTKERGIEKHYSVIVEGTPD